MNRQRRAIRFWLAAVLTCSLVQACTPATAPSSTPTAPNYDTAAPSTSLPPPTARQTEAAQPTIAPTKPSATSVPPPVTVTAVHGNIYIHRGPDLAFNPISVLMRDQSAVATGRDVLARWVQIQVPGVPERTGWVTIVTTGYTTVSGDVQHLPEVEQMSWPEIASLRNCTHHLMRTDPGGIDIPAVDYFPDNEVRINPGTYAILDMDVDKYPEVQEADVREGSAIDILTDGTGEKKKCPAP